MPRTAPLFALALLACQRPPPAREAPPRFVVRAEPSAPEHLLATLRVPSPRALGERVARLTGTPAPADLVLRSLLQLEPALLAACELAEPALLAFRADGERAPWLVALTPVRGSLLRSTLAARFRLVPEPTLGERLEVRATQVDAQAPECALVEVATPSSTRVLCASDRATLFALGPWAAWRATHGAPSGRPFDLELGATELRERLPGMLRAQTRRTVNELRESIAVERRRHARPPDLGDPEAALALLESLADAFAQDASALGAGALALEPTTEAVELTLTLALPPEAPGPLATLARVLPARAPTPPALRALLLPDAFAAWSSRAPAERHRRWLERIAEALGSILGARLGQPQALSAALRPLLESTGDELAASVARDGAGGLELLAAVSLSEEAGARRALAALPALPALRSLAWAGRHAELRPVRDGLLLRMVPDPTPPTPGAATDAGASANAASPWLGVVLRRGALVLLLSSDPSAALAALEARAADSVPGVLLRAPEAPLLLAFDPNRMDPRASAPRGDAPTLALSPGAEGPPSLRARLHVPLEALAALRALARREPRE